MPDTLLYFAYGSNMSTPRLTARLPSTRVVGVAGLAAHRLMFHKYGGDGTAKCDAFYTGDADDAVLGVVFRIAAREKPALDAVEGLGNGYEIRRVEVAARSGETLQAFTYCATRIDDALKPLDWYKEHVLFGAREHGLPDAYIRRIENVAAMPDPDVRRSTAERLIYPSRRARP